MKKILCAFVLSLALVSSSTSSAHALSLSDAAKQIAELKAEILGLKSVLGAQAIASVESSRSIPRIMYWYGKVNQHLGTDGAWVTDPDGTSGATIDKLTYCKKWYPNTVSVETYKTETATWYSRGNIDPISWPQTSDKCVQPVTSLDKCPNIAEIQVKIPVGKVLSTSGECVDEVVPETPSVTVLSPNGDEVYTPGQKITVKWKSTGIPSSSNALIIINDVVNSYGGFDVTTPNDGEESITLPSIDTYSGLIYGKNFVVRVSFVPFGGYDGKQLSDTSDTTFTIKAPATDVCPNISGVQTSVPSGMILDANGNCVTPPSDDATPRIMYWYGKVNQHLGANGTWMTDPDGVSGGDLDKLTYCKKWYPNTTSVVSYKIENATWYSRGNIEPIMWPQTSDKCVQGNATPSITVLSPNGGETFTVNSDPNSLTNWFTYRISVTSQKNGTLYKRLVKYADPANYQSGPSMDFGTSNYSAPNNTVDSGGRFGDFNLPVGQYYFMTYWKSADGTENIIDFSDTAFTIKAPSTTTCTINSFTATPTNINAYGNAILNWSTTGCAQMLIIKDTGANLAIPSNVNVSSGSVRTEPETVTRTYTLYAENMVPAGCSSLAGYSLITGTACKSGAQSKVVRITVDGSVGTENILFLGGGQSVQGGTVTLNDVYSTSNMSNWDQVSSNGSASSQKWSSRASAQAVFFNNKYWVLGGGEWGGSDVMGDVWNSLDGSTWKKVTDTAPFKGYSGSTTVVFDGKMYAIGTAPRSYGVMGGGVVKVWTSVDGATWTDINSSADFGPI